MNLRKIIRVLGLFEIDSNDDLMPIVGTSADYYYELDSNDDITPKI